MRYFLLPLGVFLVLIAFLGAGLTLNPRVVPSPFIGKPAPAFVLSRLDDAAKTISPEDMAGKVWLLNVWASWCVSCRVEHPVLMEFARTGLAPVVGLNYKDKREEGLAWLREHGNPYLLSAFDKRGRTGIDYGVVGVPETFVIDRRGIVRMKFTGPLTRQAIDEKIVPLLKELQGA